MSAQPIWITPPGNLGTVPEGSFYQVPLQVTDPNAISISNAVGNGTTVTINFATQTTLPFQVGDQIIISNVVPASYNGTFIVTSSSTSRITYTSTNTNAYVSGGTISSIHFQVIAGALPSGVECTSDGIIQGVPTNAITKAEETSIVGLNVISKFAIRAYTTQVINGVTVINRLADRTFTLTVAGQPNADWITPAGTIGQFFEGELVVPGLQLEYSIDPTVGVAPTVSLVSGSLPAGLTVSSTGLISGFIQANPSNASLAGFSRTSPPDPTPPGSQGYDEYGFDFDTSSPSYNFEFTLKVTDGVNTSLRTFDMFVWDPTTFVASTTQITSDDTYLPTSVSNVQIPSILNPQGSIGTADSSTFFAYQFIGEDLNNDTIGFIGSSIPAGLRLDPLSGWLYGYLSNVGLAEVTYNFSVTPYIYNTPATVGRVYNYSLTVTGPISSNVTWLTPSNLGSIVNGGTSLFYVEAETTSNLPLTYSLLSGSNSTLPQGLKLLPSGNIVGRVSFNTFALDGGDTTFDNNTTTFDLVYTFIVNAVSANGYINVSKTFSITVIRQYNTPYNNLYIKCMSPQSDRTTISNLLQNPSIFTPNLLYRPDDPNFGISSGVNYYHAYGLNAVNLDTYITALQLNHYWKNLTLGEIKTAQAMDPATGNIIYEVVYSEIIDDLVNNQGESVGKQVVLPYPLNNDTLQQIDDVYPNALVDMRNQVIDVVGQESDMLPLWMLSTQANGNVLGFTPAWVIAYTTPGNSGQLAYNITTQFGTPLNVIDFKADRYELDNSLTVDWDATTQQWIPSPSQSTTFDVNYHYDTSIQTNGANYAVGDQIKILGTTLGGVSPGNDLIITITHVTPYGSITEFTVEGTADIIANGNIYSAVFGTTISGIGTGAQWNIMVVPGKGAELDLTTVSWVNNSNTVVYWYNTNNITLPWTNGTTIVTTFDTMFDGGGTTFNAPAETDTNTDAYDDYLLFPRSDILTPLPVGSQLLFVNDYGGFIKWIGQSGNGILWA